MIKTNQRRISILIAMLVLCWGVAGIAVAEIAVKDGQRIAFLGDSITAKGFLNPNGYVNLTIAGLKANGIRVIAIPAGIVGHKSNQMLKRLKKDVLDRNPDWLILSCGVNDVWHGTHGVSLDEYRVNIAAIVEQCQDADVRVLILTATVIGEELDSGYNMKLAPYNEFLRTLAIEKNCRLADLNAMFQKHIVTRSKPGYLLTTDGIHMNSEGDRLMAEGILRAFGLNRSQMNKAKESW
jgi:lysophospholipase L1-like esterase